MPTSINQQRGTQMPASLQLNPFKTKEHLSYFKPPWRRPSFMACRKRQIKSWISYLILILLSLSRQSWGLESWLTDKSGALPSGSSFSRLPQQSGRIPALLQTPHQSAYWFLLYMLPSLLCITLGSLSSFTYYGKWLPTWGNPPLPSRGPRALKWLTFTTVSPNEKLLPLFIYFFCFALI